MTANGLKPETVEELIDTLSYIRREFERNERLDETNMVHVRRALRMVDHDRAAAFVAEVAHPHSRQMAAE